MATLPPDATAAAFSMPKSICEKWYQPSNADDKDIYEAARRRCQEINEDLNLGPYPLGSGDEPAPQKKQKWAKPTYRILIESAPIALVRPTKLDAESVAHFIQGEEQVLKDRGENKPMVLKKVSELASQLIVIATKLKPAIDLLVPEGPEYQVPYSCLMMIFTTFIASKEKTDKIPGHMRLLSANLPVLEFYKDLFPTTEMKTTLAEYYLHTLDLLWRLARYSRLRILTILLDAAAPRDKYDFIKYLAHIKATGDKLKTLCWAGHLAEQRTIMMRVDDINSDLHTLFTRLEDTLKATARDQQSSQQLLAVQAHSSQQLILARAQAASHAQAIHHVSALLDIWAEEIGDVENELSLWQTLTFATDGRDHWSQNGILPCIVDWRKKCETYNSVLWICSDGNGRQSWLTELSIDLIRVYQFQEAMVTFAFCDRKRGTWTPREVLLQLVAQLLYLNPRLAIEEAGVFYPRAFQRAKTFKTTFQLLLSVVAKLESLLIVIDRLDLCALDPVGGKNQNMARALSDMVKLFPQRVRIVVTTGQVVTTEELPDLAVSLATIRTRRRPRWRYVVPRRKPGDDRIDRGRWVR